MTQTINTDRPTTGMWHNVFGPATESASAAMQAWTDGHVMLSLNEVQELPLEEVMPPCIWAMRCRSWCCSTSSARLAANSFCSLMNRGSATGYLLARSSGRCFGGLGDAGAVGPGGNGNILASAYLNRVTLMTGCPVMPAPPSVLQDYAAGVLESAIIAQAIAGDQVLLCRTQFHLRGEPIEWNVFFVPSLELLATLRDCAQECVCDRLSEICQCALTWQ